MKEHKFSTRINMSIHFIQNNKETGNITECDGLRERKEVGNWGCHRGCGLRKLARL